jgi:hypothetical protein
VRYTARLLRKQPGFAAAAVVMLALGIGANTAIFSVVNSVLIKPLPYPDSESVVNVVHQVNGADLAYFSDRVYLAYTANNRSFEHFGVWAASTATVTGGGDPEQVRTLIVSHEVLPALGMRPVIGRWFSSDEGGRGAPAMVLVTDAFWHRRFGGDREVLQRSLTINAREAVWSIDGALPLARVRTLGDLYDRSMARTSFTLVLLAIAAAMTLFLGVIGIYGVLSYAVAQRRREIGIRLALGAQTRAIRVLFLRRGLAVAGIGVALGLVGAAAFTRVMESLLFGVSPLDPVTFAAMPLLLAAAAMLASYLPARRAVAVDPVETMRVE